MTKLDVALLLSPVVTAVFIGRVWVYGKHWFGMAV